MKRRTRFAGRFTVKTWHLSSALVLFGVFLSTSGVPATYDSTGQATVTSSGHWNNCSVSNPGTEESTIILIQNGNRFTVFEVDEGFIFEASVSGAQYNIQTEFCAEEGTALVFCAPMTCTLTATSDYNAAGTCNWTYRSGSTTCSGGHNVSIVKQIQSNPTYNATGLWIYAEQPGGTNNCGVTFPVPASGTLTVTQTGNKVTAVNNEGKRYDGFVSGSIYTMVAYYFENARTVSQVQTITLGSSGRRGSGFFKWFWAEEPDNFCGGEFPLLIEKAWIIQATAGFGGTISPSGSVAVPNNGNLLITIAPERGYGLRDVLVDGVSVGATRTYTFSNVLAGHTIEAVFWKIAGPPFLQLLFGD